MERAHARAAIVVTKQQRDEEIRRGCGVDGKMQFGGGDEERR